MVAKGTGPGGSQTRLETAPPTSPCAEGAASEGTSVSQYEEASTPVTLAA